MMLNHSPRYGRETQRSVTGEGPTGGLWPEWSGGAVALKENC